MSGYLSQIPYQKRLLSLAVSQFIGVFNDNAYKILALMIVINSGASLKMLVPFTLVMASAYILPFLIFTVPAGNFSDNMPKRGVMLLSKFAELLILIAGTVAVAKYTEWKFYSLLIVVFLLTIQTAYFSPAFYGILPETFSEKELSKANGDIGVTTLIASVLSLCLTPALVKGFDICLENMQILWLPVVFRNPLVLTGLLLCLLSLIGFFATIQVYPTIAGRHFTPAKVGKSPFWRGGAALLKDKAIFLAAFGDGIFVSGFFAVQILFLLLIFDNPDTFEFVDTVLFQSAPLLGLGIGSLVAGRISRNKIELGLVPYGSLGLAIFLPLAAYVHGSPSVFFGCSIHFLLIFWFFLAGFSGGFFVIPLRAYLQKDLADKDRGAGLSAANALCFFLVLIAGILILSSVGKRILPADLPNWVTAFVNFIPVVSVKKMIFCVGIFSFIAVLIVSTFFFPMLFVRAFVLFLTHSFYRLRLNGVENIPQRGPVLLVANHVSYIDSFLILACTSRRVRFLMREDIYTRPLIHFYAVRAGAICVPSGGAHRMESMFEEIKQALRDGCAVCVFPEGTVSRNGLMGSFKAGYAKMIPEGMNIPLIPVYIGMVWGSMFSYYYGKIRLRLTSRFPYPAAVSVGKPLPPSETDTAFQLRQAVAELGADAEAGPREEERTLHYRAAKNAKRHPFRKILYDQNGKSLTAFQVLVAGIIFSREIRRMMPEETHYVGMLLPNVIPAPLVLLGIQMADKVPTPLNFTASREALRISIEKAGITHILTSRKFIAKIKMEPMPEFVYLEDLAAKIPKWRKLLWFTAAVILPHNQLMNIVSPASHRDVFGTGVLLFSSGSTGQPKGVMLSHHNLNGDINSFIRVVGWTSKDRILGSLPLFHCFGFTTAYWIPLMICSPVVLVTSPLDCGAIGTALEKYGVTILLATPTFIQSYIKRCKPEQFASLRLAVVGAEKMRRDIADKFYEITNHKTALMEGYGCTELSPIVTINVSRSFQDLGRVEGKEGSIGSAMPGLCVKVVDPVTREPLPPETDGLMLVKGPNVMQGYLKAPDLTANVIRNGWYETGDIVRMDEDGYVTISGRLSRFSKIGGEMVPHELLECMMNEMTGTEERLFAVGGIPDPAKGEALAVLYLASASPITPEEMNTKLRERNIPNLWIPRAANYRAVDKLPVLGNGKLDLLALTHTIKEVFNVKTER